MRKLFIALVLVVAVGGCMAALATGSNDRPGIATSTTVAEVTDSIGKSPDTTSKPKATKPKADAFGEGMYKVGTDIKPGLYRSSGGGYWARLRSEDPSDIIANDLKSSGFLYCRVKSTDAYVEFSGGTFVRVGA